MINNLPVKTLTHKDLTIEGYSRAAVQTYWRIPELKIGFDLGAQPWAFMGTPTWFVSHTHMDHIVGPAGLRGPAADDEDGAAGDLPARGARSIPCSGSCKLFSRLDRGRLPCELAAGAAGRRNRTFARAGRDRFGHHAHGAFAGLRGLAAAAEAEAGVPGPGRRPDSRSAPGRDRGDRPRSACPAWPTSATARRRASTPARPCTQAEVLIMEMTFVAPSHRKDKIHKFGHMHLDDFLERSDRFRNELIIATPFQHALSSQSDPPARRAGPARHDRRAAAPLDLKRDQGPRRAAGFIPAVGLRHPHYQSPSSSPFQCSHVGGPLAKARRTRYLDEFAFECLPTYLL